MKSNSEALPSTVFLFYYKSIFITLQPLGSGHHEIKVNKILDWAWSDGAKRANWGSLKGYLLIELTSQLGTGRWIGSYQTRERMMTIWKSYMRTAGWRVIWKKIIAVIDATFSLRNVSARVILASGLKPRGTSHMGYIGMCRCERNDIEAVYSGIGYIN